MKAYDKQYIGGQWVEGTGAKILEDRNPYTNEILYTYRSASKADVDAAYAAAKAAQPAWAAVPANDKAILFEKLLQVFKEYIPIIDECLLLENGGTVSKRGYEAHDPENFVRYFMTFPYAMDGKIQSSVAPGRVNYVFRKPKGVITVIAPWNMPFILALRSVLPAVATGNAVVLKPASDTPATAFIVAEMFEKAGFPAGVVNAVAGSGSEIGDYLVTHPDSAMLSFTGSTEVGQHLGEICGKEVKDVSLELGGNNSMLVLADADLELASDKAVFGAYFHQGQVCMSLNRIIVVKEKYDEFCEIMRKKVSVLKAGDPSDPENFVGPIINASQVKHCTDLIAETLACGAKALVEGHTEGNVVWPWLLADVTQDMPSAQNEMFGPVVSLMKAEDEDDAVKIANDQIFGLSNCIFSADRYHAMMLAQRLESGMVHINDSSIGDEPQVMFGAEKKSGIGRFNGEWVLHKFTTEQWIPVD